MKYKVKISAQKSVTGKALSRDFDFSLRDKALEFLYQNAVFVPYEKKKKDDVDYSISYLHINAETFLVFSV